MKLRLLSLIALTLVGCGGEEFYPPDAPIPSKILYQHVQVDTELRADFLGFVGNCEQYAGAERKCQSFMPRLISVKLVDEFSVEKKPSVVGICRTLDTGFRKIEIRRSFYKQNTCSGRTLVYHELGHCALDSGHSAEGSFKIMAPSLIPEYRCRDSWPQLVDDFFNTQYAWDAEELVSRVSYLLLMPFTKRGE